MRDSRTDARAALARAHGTSPDRVAIGRSIDDAVRALAELVSGTADAPDAPRATDLAAALDGPAARGRILLVASPSVPEGRALTRDELVLLTEATPTGGLTVIDESLSAYASSPRAAFAAPLLGPPLEDPRIAVVRSLPDSAACVFAAPDVALRIRLEDPTDAQLETVVRGFSPEGLDDALDRADWIRAERQRIERTLRDRMEKAAAEGRPSIEIVHSDGDAVWLPVGDRADDLAARAGGTVYPGRGVRYRVGNDNDAFIDAVSEWATA